MTWQTALARGRVPLLVVGVAQLFLGGWVGLPFWARFVLFVAVYLVALRAGTVRRDPIRVAVPVRGNWVALNSPATKVPSHGLQGYGQTYAIDLVPDPERLGWQGVGWRPSFRPADTFPGFGQPVFAAADGMVVRARDRARDHRARNTWPALVYLVVEGAVRELTGPGRIVGNHLVVDHGDGVFAAYAHLKRGSLRVAEGDRIRAGQHIADCGNSGNSSEPHLHLQLMDHPRLSMAAGLPMSFDAYRVGDREVTGELPANTQMFHVDGPDQMTEPDRAIEPDGADDADRA